MKPLDNRLISHWRNKVKVSSIDTYHGQRPYADQQKFERWNERELAAQLGRDATANKLTDKDVAVYFHPSIRPEINSEKYSMSAWVFTDAQYADALRIAYEAGKQDAQDAQTKPLHAEIERLEEKLARIKEYFD